ncbi:MAG: L-erythro-3,5-diaminohexanoate dehydrogenase [Bacillota bacterium]
MKKGNIFGTHRVLEPIGVLPQPAEKLDNTMEIYDNEILLNVQTLNIDSASFTQLQQEAGGDVEKIKAKMLEIVEERGKHHNPVTGSGGMLLGTVAEIGPALQDRDLKVGEKVATLVSLSLTPLRIDKIKAVRPEVDQVDIDGQAILFESGIYAKLPEDMSETLALAVLDVAGAPAQTAKLVETGDNVLIIGAGGKSGLLCLHEARKKAGNHGRVIALDYGSAALERIAKLELADAVIKADATKPMEVYEKVLEASQGELMDVVINSVNIPGTEMSSILPTRDGGKIYFFSMATSFTRAALGAEGVGKDVEMITGNGYTRNHAEIALQVMRENEEIRDIFERIYTI